MSKKSAPAPGNGAVGQADATQKTILDGFGDEYSKTLWKGRGYSKFKDGPASPVNFPNRNNIPAEVAQLKARLKQQAASQGNQLDLRLRETNYKAGMFFGKPTDPTAVTADTLTLNQIDAVITEGLMANYYALVGAKPQDSQPIPHDLVHLGQELWLPGLFVIDQIFAALVTETWRKCIAYNQAKDAGAKAELQSFVDGISQGPTGNKNPDAEKYLPFINYTGDAKDKTWINLLYDTDNYVVGALVHVHDWAAGTHSNGTGIP